MNAEYSVTSSNVYIWINNPKVAAQYRTTVTMIYMSLLFVNTFMAQ